MTSDLRRRAIDPLSMLTKFGDPRLNGLGGDVRTDRQRETKRDRQRHTQTDDLVLYYILYHYVWTVKHDIKMSQRIGLFF